MTVYLLSNGLVLADGSLYQEFVKTMPRGREGGVRLRELKLRELKSFEKSSTLAAHEKGMCPPPHRPKIDYTKLP